MVALPSLIDLPLGLLQDEMDARHFRAALLVARDCWEAIIKFCAIALHSDLMHLGDVALERETVQLVWRLTSKPPSMGDWLAFFANCSSVALQSPAHEQLLLPELCRFIHTPTRRAGQLPRLTSDGRKLAQAVEWRNQTIGHGASSQDIREVEEEAKEQQRRLEEVLADLTFLSNVRLLSVLAPDNVLEWVGRQPSPSEHTFRPQQHGVFPMSLQHRNASLDLTPLILTLVDADGPSLLTFEKSGNGYYYLDHVHGKTNRFHRLLELSALLDRYSAIVREERLQNFEAGGALAVAASAYSGSVVRSLESIEFGSDMEASFTRQTYIYEALERKLAEFATQEGRGYFHFVAPAGAGKTWFMASLANPSVCAYAGDVLCYHIRIGMRQNPELFIESLHNQVQRSQGHNVRGARVRLEDADTPSQAVATFCEEVLHASARERILLVVDGLDELVEPDRAEDDSIADYIPRPDELPEDVMVIISSRPEHELRPRARQLLDVIRQSDSLYERFDLTDHSNAQNQVLQMYLMKRQGIHDDNLLQTILLACKGSFLLATLYGKLYASADKGETVALPSDIGRVFAVYLTRRAQQIGQTMFERLHGPVLDLLATSPIPLTLSQIADFIGQQSERVLFALFDVGEFLASIRHDADNAFAIVHNEFTERLLTFHHEQIDGILHKIVDSFYDDPQSAAWLLEANDMLRRTGHPRLGLSLSDALLAKMSPGSAGRIDLLRMRSDMVHIVGSYRAAASTLADLVHELTAVQGLPDDDPEIVATRIRQAHHLKFVAPIESVRESLANLVQVLPEDHPLLPEVQFTLYGSIGCLDDPGSTELAHLYAVADQCRQSGDDYLLSRCLRRIADLLLCTRSADEALLAATEAREIAGRMASRQTIYLNSTLAEILRYQGDLDASFKYHSSTLEQSEQRELPGWAGHGALGLAEVYRMRGNFDRAQRSLDLAAQHYVHADSQVWGLVHAHISRALSTGSRIDLEQALKLAKATGYRRDARYIEHLMSRLQGPSSMHEDHFLLFV